jgi:hypothetical protein
MQGYVGCEPAGSSAAWECWGAGVIIRYALITSDGRPGASSIGTAPKPGDRSTQQARTRECVGRGGLVSPASLNTASSLRRQCTGADTSQTLLGRLR